MDSRLRLHRPLPDGLPMGEKWRDADAWDRLTSPDGCPICVRGEPLDVLVSLSVSWVTGGRVAPLPGYVCVVAKRHVIEPFELPDDERARFWEEAMITARALAAATVAVKMGYEIHGFSIPHLHMHLFPRRRDEPRDGQAEYARSDTELRRLAVAISGAATDQRPAAR